MPLSFLPTRTRILFAFGVMMLTIILITSAAAWCLRAADQLATDLVTDKLVRQQLAAGLMGEARLAGLATVAIARSDSLEVADYFQLQLAQGDQQAEHLMRRLAAMPHDAEERARIDAVVAQALAARNAGTEIMKQKNMGRTQDVEALLASSLQPALARHAAALQALLDLETREARQQAQASGAASTTSLALMIALGLAALAMAVVLASRLTLSIVPPLQQALALARQVAEGNLRARVHHQRPDEIGQLFDVLNDITDASQVTAVHVHKSVHAAHGWHSRPMSWR